MTFGDIEDSSKGPFTLMYEKSSLMGKDEYSDEVWLLILPMEVKPSSSPIGTCSSIFQ